MASSFNMNEVEATIIGVGGCFQIGQGCGLVADGIKISNGNGVSTMTKGADGIVMHVLNADRSGTITITTLRDSSVNAKLMLMFNIQTVSARLHGHNTILVRYPVTGDLIVCTGVAFKGKPDLVYGASNHNMTWTFDAARIDSHLGSYD